MAGLSRGLAAAFASAGVLALLGVWSRRFASTQGEWGVPVWWLGAGFALCALSAWLGSARSAPAASVRCALAGLLAIAVEWAWGGDGGGAVGVPWLLLGAGVPAWSVAGAASSLGRGPQRAACAVGALAGCGVGTAMPMLVGPGEDAVRLGAGLLIAAALFAAGWQRSEHRAAERPGGGTAAAALVVVGLLMVVAPAVRPEVGVWAPWTIPSLWGGLTAGALVGVVWAPAPTWPAAAAAVVLALETHLFGGQGLAWSARGLLAPAVLAGMALGAGAWRGSAMALPTGFAALLGVPAVACLGVFAEAAGVRVPWMEPWLAPGLAVGLAALVLLCRGAAGWLGLLVLGGALLLGASGRGAPWRPVAPPSVDAERREIARRGGDVLAVDRTSGVVQLERAGVVVERWGPGVVDAAALSQLPMLVGARPQRALVLGGGSPRVCEGLTAWSVPCVEVGARPALGRGLPLDLDGPGPRKAEDGRIEVDLREGVLDQLAWLPCDTVRARVEALAPVGAVTWSRPLDRRDAGWLERGMQQLLRDRIEGRGAVVVGLRIDTWSGHEIAAAAATMASVHGRCRAFLVRELLLLVGVPFGGDPGEAAEDAARAPVDRAPRAARAFLHDVGWIAVDDLEWSELPIVALAADEDDDGESIGGERSDGGVLDRRATVLDRWIAAAAEGASEERVRERLMVRAAAVDLARPLAPLSREPSDPRAVLARREWFAAHVRRLAQGGIAEPARGAVAARALAHRAHGEARLWLLRAVRPVGAAVAAPGALEPAEALRAAQALDPLIAIRPWFARLEVFAERAGTAVEGVLDDITRWPEGPELAAFAVDPGPRGIATRGRMPLASARALVGRLAERPLSDREARALAAVVDPWTLSAALEAVRAREGGLHDELLPLWRGDLPAAAGMEALVGGSAAERLRLAEALARRPDPRSHSMLAELLQDPELSVRRAAATALHHTVGGDVNYDPEAEPAAWRRAAAALRSLHRSEAP